MLCREIMKNSVQCITLSDTVKSAAKRMRDANIGFLPVCDDNNRDLVVGTVTDRDIAMRCVAEGRQSNMAVSDVMSRQVICCLPTDDVKRAQELMAKHQKSRIVCCDEAGRLKGVISLSDIAIRTDGASAANTLRQVVAREASGSSAP